MFALPHVAGNTSEGSLLGQGDGRRVLLMFGREGRRMTGENVANDSLWGTESHPRTTCYRRCPADPGGSRRGPLLWPTSPRLCVERIRWHALASLCRGAHPVGRIQC